MASEKERKIRGSVLDGYRKYIKKKWGSDGLDDCARVTGTDLRQLQEEGWYNFMVSVDILDWMKDKYGIDCCRQAGYHIVTDGFIISWAARIMGINRVLEKGIDDYRHSLNYGQIEIEQEEKRAKVILTDVLVKDSDTMTWVGVLQGVLKITNKDGQVTHKTEGDTCTFSLKWK